MKRFVYSVVVCVCTGCGTARTEPGEFSAPVSASQEPVSASQEDAPQAAEIIITNVADLPKHVGKIVTLKAIQSRTKLPQLLGVYVDGDYKLSDKMAFATGRLSSYETTAADVRAFDRRMKKSPFASPRPSVGTHFQLTDLESGKKSKTHIWNDRKNSRLRKESRESCSEFNRS